MQDDIYEQALELQRTIKSLKQSLKEAESEYADAIRTIRTGGLTSIDYELVPDRAPSREVNVGWFRDHEPATYSSIARVPNNVAVAIMSNICGSEFEFNRRLRDGDVETFDQNAKITITDLQNYVGGESLEQYENAGVISRGEPKSYKIVRCLSYISEAKRREAAEGMG